MQASRGAVLCDEQIVLPWKALAVEAPVGIPRDVDVSTFICADRMSGIIWRRTDCTRPKQCAVGQILVHEPVQAAVRGFSSHRSQVIKRTKVTDNKDATGSIHRQAFDKVVGRRSEESRPHHGTARGELENKAVGTLRNLCLAVDAAISISSQIPLTISVDVDAFCITVAA
jgi:hypothetical protein